MAGPAVRSRGQGGPRTFTFAARPPGPPPRRFCPTAADTRVRRPPRRAPQLAAPGASAHFRRKLHGGDLDVSHQTPCLARVDQPGPEAPSRLGAAGHTEAQALV